MIGKLSNFGKFALIQYIRVNRVRAWVSRRPLFITVPGGVGFVIDCPISSREIAEEYERRICTHPIVQEFALSGKQWDGAECLGGHYFSNLTPKPACWVCPHCLRHVSYEQRQGMKVKSTSWAWR